VFDFFLRTKVPRASSLVTTLNGVDTEQQNVSRYYVSVSGSSMFKLSPPLEKMITKWNTVAHWKHRDNGKTVNSPKPPSGKFDQIPKPSDAPPVKRDAIKKNWLVTVCNSIQGHEFNDINYDYYIAETHKIVDELLS
jgi:hypothetical protein